MTMAVAKWLVEDDKHETSTLIKCMQGLGRKYRNAGYGSNFGQWLDTENPEPYGSWGNGAAMRVSPCACVLDSLKGTLALAEKSASVSHNHPEGIKGAQCVAKMIWNNLNKYKNEEILIEIPREFYSAESLTRSPQQIRDSGYKFEVSCQKSVPEAISCFLYSHSYEETIREAILLRGDTDTQACIAGSLAAAYWGIPKDLADETLDRLPSDLLNILEDFSKMYNLDL
jgi:ADP-ribosylglycohydrolase